MKIPKLCPISSKITYLKFVEVLHLHDWGYIQSIVISVRSLSHTSYGVAMTSPSGIEVRTIYFLRIQI